MRWSGGAVGVAERPKSAGAMIRWVCSGEADRQQRQKEAAPRLERIYGKTEMTPPRIFDAAILFPGQKVAEPLFAEQVQPVELTVERRRKRFEKDISQRTRNLYSNARFAVTPLADRLQQDLPPSPPATSSWSMPAAAPVIDERYRLRQLALLLAESEEAAKPKTPVRPRRPRLKEPPGCSEWAKQVVAARPTPAELDELGTPNPTPKRTSFGEGNDAEDGRRLSVSTPHRRLSAQKSPAPSSRQGSRRVNRGSVASSPRGSVGTERSRKGATPTPSSSPTRRRITAAATPTSSMSQRRPTGSQAASGEAGHPMQGLATLGRRSTSKGQDPVRDHDARKPTMMALENQLDVKDVLTRCSGPPDLACPNLEDKPLRNIFDFFCNTSEQVHRERLVEVVEVLGMRVVPERVQALCEMNGRTHYDFSLFQGFLHQYWEISRTEALTSVFNRFRSDGEVHRDSLKFTLEFMNMHPVEQWIDDVFTSITTFSTLNFGEFQLFITSYWRRQQDEYAIAYRECDEDGSGEIDSDELATLLAFLGIEPLEPVIQEIIAEVDEDGSGSIDMTEFKKVVNLLHQREGFTKNEYERLMTTFNIFDWDSSGTVCKEEVLKTLEYLAYSLDERQAMMIFQELDVDGRGELNEHEYIVFMRKVREFELFKIQSLLRNKHFAKDKEEALLRLLAEFDRLPDMSAVQECALAVGIDLVRPTSPTSPEDEEEEERGPARARAIEFWHLLRCEVLDQNQSRGGEHWGTRNSAFSRLTSSPRKDSTGPAQKEQEKEQKQEQEKDPEVGQDDGVRSRSPGQDDGVKSRSHGQDDGVRSRSPGQTSDGSRKLDSALLNNFKQMRESSRTASLEQHLQPPAAAQNSASETPQSSKESHKEGKSKRQNKFSWIANSMSAPKEQSMAGSKDESKEKTPQQLAQAAPTGQSESSESARSEGWRDPGVCQEVEGEPVLSMGEAWKFLEVYRTREGLTELQLEENKFAFYEVSGTTDENVYMPSPPGRRKALAAGLQKEPEKEVEIGIDACAKALRWLGWGSSYNLFMLTTGEIDLDGSGEISIIEFNKLVRLYNEREIKELREQFWKSGIDCSNTKSPVFFTKVQSALSRLGMRGLEQRRVLDKLGLADATQACDFFQLFSAVRELRHEERSSCRKNHGYSPKEVEAHRWVFRSYTDCGSGEVVEHRMLSVLLEEVFPRESYGVIDWRYLLNQLPGYQLHNGQFTEMTFAQFLQLNRMWSNNAEQSAKEKEQRIIAKTRFTPIEVREFRRIFVEQDVHRQDVLDYATIKGLVQLLTPLGDKLAHEFRHMWNVVTRAEHGKSQEVLDFSEFLILMRMIIDSDFAKINTKLEKQVKAT